MIMHIFQLISMVEIHFLMAVKRGRAIAEAVSHWLPTVAAQVRAWVWRVGFVVEKWCRGRLSPSTSVSPARTVHSTNFIIIIIIAITRGS
jgi:hypothetical protein